MIDTAPLETCQLPSEKASHLSDDPDDGKGMEWAWRQPQPPALSLCAECFCPQQSCQHPALCTAESRDPGSCPAAFVATGFAQSHRHPAPHRVSSGARTAGNSRNAEMHSKVRRLKKTNPSFPYTPNIGTVWHQPQQARRNSSAFRWEPLKSLV